VQGPCCQRGNRRYATVCSHPVDLVLLDYHMPGMNGDVVAEHMKSNQPDVPIALLSADDGLPESALRWVDVFVSKSESPAKLLRTVEYLLALRFLFIPLDLLTGGRDKNGSLRSWPAWPVGGRSLSKSGRFECRSHPDTHISDCPGEDSQPGELAHKANPRHLGRSPVIGSNQHRRAVQIRKTNVPLPLLSPES
jgi:hypothetical protein